MEMYEIRHGALLMCGFNGGPLEVVKVLNPKIKKITVQRENGERWDVYPRSLSRPEGTVTFDLKVQEATGLLLGTVVRFTKGERQGMWVVAALDRGAGFKLHPLFGTPGNRYVRDVPATMIEVVDRKGLAAWLSYTSV